MNELDVFFFALVPAALLGFFTAISRLDRLTYFSISIISISVQSAVIGLRDPSMGQDTIEYIRLFQGTSQYSGNIEPAFMALLATLGTISTSAQYFLISYALILNGVIFAAYEKIMPTKGLFLFSIFSFTHVYWLIHIQTMRNGLAAALLILGIAYFLSNRRFLAFFYAILGATFHYSMAGVAAALFLFSRFRRFKAKSLLFGFAGAIIAIYLAIAVLPTLSAFSAWEARLTAYAYYNETTFRGASIGFQHIFLVLIIMIFLVRYRQLTPIQINLFLVYFFITAISFAFWQNILFRDRLFLPAQILEPVLLYFAFTGQHINRILGALLMLLFGIFWSIMVIYIWGPNNIMS